MGKTVFESKTDDGMRVILRETKDGIQVSLREDLDLYPSDSRIMNLVEIIRIITEVDSVEREHTEKELMVRLKINEVEKLEGLEAILAKQIKLYKNLQKALEKTIDDFQKMPKTLADDIEFFTHLGIEKKRIKRFSELAYFLRELYALIEIKTGISREQIISKTHRMKITRERAIVMYLLRKRFDFLTSPGIGKILGELGKPRNHATVLLALKKFKKESDEEFYKKEDDISKLYKRARKGYIAPKKLSAQET